MKKGGIITPAHNFARSAGYELHSTAYLEKAVVMHELKATGKSLKGLSYGVVFESHPRYLIRSKVDHSNSPRIGTESEELFVVTNTKLAEWN